MDATDSDPSGSAFTDANLSGASCNQTDLSGAEFAACRLAGVPLEDLVRKARGEAGPAD